MNYGSGVGDQPGHQRLVQHRALHQLDRGVAGAAQVEVVPSPGGQVVEDQHPGHPRVRLW